MSDPQIHVQIESFSYSPIPFDSIDRATWAVTVERAGPDLWAVRNGSRCLNRINGEWDYEPIPSSRTDDWLRAHRWRVLEAAQAAAVQVCGLVTWNGRTAEQIAERVSS